MSLLFNTLSRFVIAFLLRKHLLISWLQSPSAVILDRGSLLIITMRSGKQKPEAQEPVWTDNVTFDLH